MNGKLLRGDVSHGCQHCNAPMLQLSLTTALEVLHTAIGGESWHKGSYSLFTNATNDTCEAKSPAVLQVNSPCMLPSCRIPESNRVLNSELVLKSAQRRGGVVGPVTPSAACEAVLHTRHGKAKGRRMSLGIRLFNLCVWFLLLLLRSH